MRSGALAPPMGGAGSIVEIDETYIGKKVGKAKRRGYGHKHAVLTLVNRKGEARSFHIQSASAAVVIPIVRANISEEAKIATDEAPLYRYLDTGFAGHESVNHGKEEWSRGEFHTNTVDGYFSIFKRGMKGIYQHCSEKHLHRYLAEYDFRYSNRSALGIDDDARARAALKGIGGKRLTYRRPAQAL
jgi:hypothetical protein